MPKWDDLATRYNHEVIGAVLFAYAGEIIKLWEAANIITSKHATGDNDDVSKCTVEYFDVHRLGAAVSALRHLYGGGRQ